jgi:hypothetical protein
MFEKLHRSRKTQLWLGLLTGIAFGFLLQKGGVTRYDVIMGQLLLTDFTVVKIMLTAMATGMVGIYTMRSLGLVRLNPKPGSIGSSVVGGLIFGVGFATLGYCPGTVAGAIGNGYLDALAGGAVGILIGAAVFAHFFPRLDRWVLNWGSVGTITIPELLKVNAWIVIIPLVTVVVLLLQWVP